MSFYSAISKNYDEIFPVSIDHINFVKYYLKSYDQPSILDIGCADGKILSLAQDNYLEGIGIDLDESMIELATRIYQNEQLKFMTLNMLQIGEYFNGKFFDVISCFGNTLVHLTGDEIIDFLGQAKNLLTQKGVLLLQILNYDYIFEHNITQLPTIKTEKILFEREYELISEDKIIFKASLTDYALGEQEDNQLTLYPIGKEVLTKILLAAGFQEIIYYKDFKHSEYDGEHLPLIIVAK